MLRRVLFRLHWLIGLSASVVLAVVGATGALMAYEDELLRALNPGVLTLPARSGPAPTLPQVAAQARAAMPDRPVTFVTAASDPTQPWRVWYAWPPGKHGGSSRGELRYIDAATGTLLPEARAQRFFATVKLLHRTLLADEIGKQIVGASTIGLVVMALSGLYLRWPRRVSNWRSWLVIRWSRAGRIRWWDVHTVIGTLVLPLYLLAAFSGLYWAYDWYRDGLQRLAGMPVVSKAKPVEVPRKPLEDAAIERTWNAFLDNASNYGTATLRIDDARTGQVDINWLPADAPHDRAFNRLTLDACNRRLDALLGGVVFARRNIDDGGCLHFRHGFARGGNRRRSGRLSSLRSRRLRGCGRLSGRWRSLLSHLCGRRFAAWVQHDPGPDTGGQYDNCRRNAVAPPRLFRCLAVGRNAALQARQDARMPGLIGLGFRIEERWGPFLFQIAVITHHGSRIEIECAANVWITNKRRFRWWLLILSLALPKDK